MIDFEQILYDSVFISRKGPALPFEGQRGGSRGRKKGRTVARASIMVFLGRSGRGQPVSLGLANLVTCSLFWNIEVVPSFLFCHPGSGYGKRIMASCGRVK